MERGNTMNDFIFHNPAKVYFGKNQLEHLPEELAAFGTKVLMVYGGGPSRRAACTTRCAAFWKAPAWSCSSWQASSPTRAIPPRTGEPPSAGRTASTWCPWPWAADSYRLREGRRRGGQDRGRRRMATGRGRRMGDRCPARGGRAHQRCNRFRDGCLSVISNMDVNQKIGLGGSALIPRVAFENPSTATPLPAYQTACGAFDIFNHVLDNYYLAGDATFDPQFLEMQEAVMRTVVKWTPVALEEPQNYEARANLMRHRPWRSTRCSMRGRCTGVRAI